MKPAVPLSEFIVELLMEGMLLYAVYIFFFITLVLVIYLAHKTQWRVKPPKPHRDDNDRAA